MKPSYIGKEGSTLAEKLCFTINHEAWHKAVEADIRKEQYRRVRLNRKMGIDILVSPIICELFFPESLVSYGMDLLYLSVEDVEAMELVEKKCYKAYRKAKTAVRNLLRLYWLERIRFASRAIGNQWDDSLKMIATPPTADEYAGICWRGGAGFGYLH